MFEKRKIPDHTYQELIDLYGKEKAEQIIINCNYNFTLITNRILFKNIGRLFRISGVINWIETKLKIKFLTFSILVGIFSLLLYIFWTW